MKNVFFWIGHKYFFLAFFWRKEWMKKFRISTNPSTNPFDKMPNFATFLIVCFDCQ